MSIISFWGKESENLTKAESIVAITTYLAIKHNYKILVVDTNYKNYFYYDCYWKENKTKSMIPGLSLINATASGINTLSRAILSNQTSPEIIKNYTKLVFKDRLEILTDTTQTASDYETNKKTFKDIVLMASKYYDLVFVDISNDLDEHTRNSLLGISNLIVADISQKIRQIDQYIELRKTDSIFMEKPIMTFISRYDRKSKYNTKNVARYIKEKRGVYGIPYNTLFFEASNEGNVADFFIKFRNINIKDKNKNALFMQSVGSMAENIIYRLQEIQMQM